MPVLSSWLGGVMLACQTRDPEVTGLTLAVSPVALPGNHLRQVVFTHLPLFTKQYNSVPLKGW